MSNIKDILCTEKNVILQVSSEDLKAFAQEILIGAKSIAMIEAEMVATSDKLLTIDEAAKLLSVSKMTLYRWDQNGILKKPLPQERHRTSRRLQNVKEGLIMENKVQHSSIGTLRLHEDVELPIDGSLK